MRFTVSVLLLVFAAVQCGSAETEYTIRTIAGTSYAGDGGSAAAALLAQPEGIAVDPAGVVFVSDAADHRVRRIGADASVQTIAGTGAAGYRGDGGPAAQAQLNSPYGLCLDRSGNLYVADLANARVRRIAPDGRITTFAGGGEAEPGTASGKPATAVRMVQPRNVAADLQGNIYVSDFGAHRIYRIDAAGLLTTVAGTGESGYAGDSGPALMAKLSYPAGVAVDALGALYIGDTGNRRIRKVTGRSISTITDSAGKPLEFGATTGVAVSASQTLYIADGGDFVTLVLPNGSFTKVPPGGGDISVDPAGRIYTTGSRRVSRFDGLSSAVLAGTGFGLYSGDGRPPAEWRFNGPAGLARDRDGNLYIADTANGRVRQLNFAGGLKSVISGLSMPTGLAFDSVGRLYVSDAKTGLIHRMDRNGKTTVFAPGLSGRPFRQPAGLAFDASGNLYVADSGDNAIFRVAQDGSATLLAGGGGMDGDGSALALRLAQPYGLAFDASGVLWFTESGSSRIRKLDLAANSVTTLARTEFQQPRGIAFDSSGSAYVADAGLNRILKIAPDGNWRPIAGNREQGFSGEEGPALGAALSNPCGILVANDSILFADTGNGRIRELVAASTDPVRLTVLHAATRKIQPVAPGQLIVVTADMPMPSAPSEAQLEIGGIAATALAASPGEIVAQAPAGLPNGGTTAVLKQSGRVWGQGTMEITPLAPAILAEGGRALAINEDGTVNSLDAPAPRGSVVSLFLTGMGTKGDPSLSVEAGGIASDVFYAGFAPGMPGVFQINARIPGGFAAPGPIPVKVLIDGTPTQDGITIATR